MALSGEDAGVSNAPGAAVGTRMRTDPFLAPSGLDFVAKFKNIWSCGFPLKSGRFLRGVGGRDLTEWGISLIPAVSLEVRTNFRMDSMPEPSDATTEESGAIELPTSEAKRPPRQAIRGSLRKLTEKDSTSPAVVEILLEDVERLEAEKKYLAGFQEKYHAKDKEAAISMSQLVSWRKGDVLYTICIAIGSAFLGGAPSFEGRPQLFLLVSCAILILGALAFRFWPVWRDQRK